MEEPHDLPFKVDDQAEAKSFEKGFRGAWFRCKIKKISWRKGQLGYALEYYDFPDEEVKWTKVYQVPGYGKKSKGLKRHLMVRPQYPPMYRGDQKPPIESLSEVAVIIEGSWKVGDWVEWHEKDCYWSARVVKLLDNERVQIELPLDPAGEGGSYEACCKDLRPRLDWTPEQGWRLNTLEGANNCCARLVSPANQGVSNTRNQHPERPVSMDVEFEPETRESTMDVAVRNSVLEKAGSSGRDEVGENVFEKASSTGSISTSYVDTSKAESTGVASGQDISQERFGSVSKRLSANYLREDTLESAIIDLEEVLNKVKWIKSILEPRTSFSCENKSWKVVGNLDLHTQN